MVWDSRPITPVSQIQKQAIGLIDRDEKTFSDNQLKTNFCQIKVCIFNQLENIQKKTKKRKKTNKLPSKRDSRRKHLKNY